MIAIILDRVMMETREGSLKVLLKQNLTAFITSAKFIDNQTDDFKTILQQSGVRTRRQKMHMTVEVWGSDNITKC